MATSDHSQTVVPDYRIAMVGNYADEKTLRARQKIDQVRPMDRFQAYLYSAVLNNAYEESGRVALRFGSATTFGRQYGGAMIDRWMFHSIEKFLSNQDRILSEFAGAVRREIVECAKIKISTGPNAIWDYVKINEIHLDSRVGAAQFGEVPESFFMVCAAVDARVDKTKIRSAIFENLEMKDYGE